MRDFSWRPILFSAGASILAAVLSGPVSGAKALTVFTFEDFPPSPSIFADPDEINTTLYGCNGKTFCTNQEVLDVHDNGIGFLSTTRDGIEGVFSRPPITFPFAGGIGIFEGENGLNPGDVEGSGDYAPYVADFSRPMRFGQVSVGLNPENELGDHSFLEIWSEPGATGTLLGRTQLMEPSPPLSLNAPAGTAFRSMRFGIGFDVPGCESGCLDFEGGGEQGVASHIGVEPIPEPSGAVLFSTALLIAGVATRRRMRAFSERAQ